jgi:hypothetical protein
MLTHQDLNELAERIEARVDKRCDAIDDRLDKVNGRLQQTERHVAVLQWAYGLGAAIAGFFTFRELGK